MGFIVIVARVGALIHQANVPTNISYRVHNELYRTTIMLGGLIVIDIYRKQATRYEHFCGINSVFATKLRSWGEAGVVNTRSWSTTKITERVTRCMIVGYNQGTGVDGYRMWHPCDI